MKLRFISARLSPCDAWAPPSLAPHSLGKPSPTARSYIGGGCQHILGKHMSESQIINATRKWVEDVVVGYNLCPFAKRELVKNRVRFTVTDANNEDDLLQALHSELQCLEDEPGIETTLLIHPDVLQDFYAYNEFLDAADALLAYLELEGVYQIASFHPDYQFAETEPGAAEKIGRASC